MLRPKRFRPIALVALLLCLSGPPLLAQETATGDGRDPVSLNFANAEIESVIKAIGKISGHNFLIDPRVKGTLNIVTNTPVPRHMTYDILLSALRLQGYTAIEGAGVTKIVPETDAKLHAVPVTKGSKRHGGEQMVTQVFTLKYESAAQMLNVVRPLVAPNNTVNAFPANNSLVITDYADNIARISRIIDSVDVPQNGVMVVELKHAAAADIAESVTKLMGGGTGNSTQSASANSTGGGDATQVLTIVPEPRTNSVLVRADNPAKLMSVRKLIDSLDRPGAGGNIHVVYLRNADATQVAQTLNGILTGQSSDTSASSNTGLSSTDSKSTSGTNNSTSSSTSTRSTSSTSMNNTTRLGSSNNKGTGNTKTAQSGPVQADTASNALIITAPDAVYNNIRHIIEQLDRRRAQIYVEALIAEISNERASSIGIQWNANKGNVTAGTNFGTTGNILSAISASASGGITTTLGQGLNILATGGTMTIPINGTNYTVANLGFLAQFLETDDKTNILSTPNLITLDNEEARIIVGQNVPMPSGTYTNTGSTTSSLNPFTTYERQDVGLTLQIKPKITEGGLVQMQIYQEASSLVESTMTSASGPTTNKRSIESSVIVDDGSIIALGGLVQDSYSGSVDKVPYLGDIPVLGQLFRYDNRSRKKTNLVVFLRPIILRDSKDNARITNPRYDYVVGQQRQVAAPRDLMPRENLPAELPPFGAPPPAVPYAPTPAEREAAEGIPTNRTPEPIIP